jgi:hypothetical protein
MKAGQKLRTLREGERRYRGDKDPVSTTDPRAAQADFDREAGR